MKIQLLVFVFLFGSIAVGGDKIGSGGGIWGCKSAQELKHGMLVDLYEAKEEYSLDPIHSESAPFDIVQARADYLAANLQEYAQIFKPFLAEVKSKIHYVDAVVRPIEDSLYHIIPLPKYCPEGAWEYVQFANFTEEGLVLIQKDLWESSTISTLDKSALIWHEAIYRWLRVEKGDTNSIRARRIVGVLYSTLSAGAMRIQIQTILGTDSGSTPQPDPSQNSYPTKLPSWLCMTENFSTRKVFLGSNEVRREAEIASFDSCQSAPAGGACSESTMECDLVMFETSHHFCEIRNLATNHIYTAHGRSAVEAKHKTLIACQNGANSYGQCLLQDVACQMNP